RRGDRLDQKTSAAHAAGRRIDVQILQIAGVLGRPGVLVKQEMHDAEDAIGRVARAQAAYASVEYALPRGQGGGGGKYHDVEALVFRPKLQPAGMVRRLQGHDSHRIARAQSAAVHGAPPFMALDPGPIHRPRPRTLGRPSAGRRPWAAWRHDSSSGA